MAEDLLNSNSPPVRCDLSDGDMINAELTITSFFDSDGKLKYGVHQAGNVNLAQMVGLLELSKRLVIASYEADIIEEEDDDDGSG